MASLHRVASLVASLAGVHGRAAGDSCGIDGAYDAGSTLARARFDDLAARANAAASAGIEALLACGDMSPAALAALADAIESEIGKLHGVLDTPLSVRVERSRDTPSSNAENKTSTSLGRSLDFARDERVGLVTNSSRQSSRA